MLERVVVANRNVEDGRWPTVTERGRWWRTLKKRGCREPCVKEEEVANRGRRGWRVANHGID